MDHVHYFSGAVYSHYSVIDRSRSLVSVLLSATFGSESAAFNCSVGVLSGQEELVLTQFRM